MKISVEIGGFGIRVATQCQRMIEQIEIGNSASPDLLSSVALMTPNEDIIIGDIANMGEQNNGMQFFLPEMLHNDINFVKTHTALFAYIKQRAENQMKKSVSEVVMVIPPYFAKMDPRKSKFEEAWNNVSVQSVSYVSSDVSICYKRVNLLNNEAALILDIGHNGTNISIVKRTSTSLQSIYAKHIEMLSGREFNSIIYQDIETKCAIRYDDEMQLLQVKCLDDLCRNIKESLSVIDSISVQPPFCEYSYSISRDDFEQMIKGIVEASIKECVAAINSSGENICKIVIAGGGALIPYIRKLLHLFFNSGESNKMEILYPQSQISAMFDSCKGALLIQSSNDILKIF